MTDHQPDLWHSPAPRKRKRHKTATTSVDAFHDAREAGRLQRTEQIVLDAFRSIGPATRHQVAAVTGLPLSSVCGRAHRLLHDGHLRHQVVNGKRVVRDGRHVLEAVIVHTQRRAG